jgi:hypothetical protein
VLGELSFVFKKGGGEGFTDFQKAANNGVKLREALVGRRGMNGVRLVSLRPPY